MSRLITVFCLLAVLIGAPLWLLMAGFSPGLLPASDTAARTAARVVGASVFAAIWLVPLWVCYFFWRLIKAWRAGASTTRSALLMALPMVLITAFIAYINLRGVAP